jgi:lysine 2,3-aminomutase
MNDQTAGSPEVSANSSLFVAETEEPPGTGQNFSSAPKHCQILSAAPQAIRHPRWRDVDDRLWQDWHWQRQHAIRTVDQLTELLPFSPAEIATLKSLEAKYRMVVPPYYFSLIDINDPHDPIRLQAIPSPLEATTESEVELDDPLDEEQDSPVPGVIHRYPDRALLITTPVCSMYCRFCTRKRVTMDREGWDAPSHDEQRMIEYIRETADIRDVILSGGDPLTLPVAKLRWFITQLAAIDHVDVIRVGTRVPVTLPQRLFDPELIDLLAAAEKIWIQTHFNHPREITPEATVACRALVNAGMPISNHCVLLKGVNDNPEIMRSLVRELLRIKVRPYYMFHCDPVTGAGHFRTSVWKGLEIIESLRGHVSGLGVPTYVVDGLHGAGKIPLMPNYLISASDNAVVLRNYEGMIFRYQPEDGSDAGPTSSSPQDVNAVLHGDCQPMVPTNSVRQQRRRKSSEKRRQASASSSTAPLADAKSNSSIKTAGGKLLLNGSHKSPANGNGSIAKNGRKSQANGTVQNSRRATPQVLTGPISLPIAAGDLSPVESISGSTSNLSTGNGASS